MGGLNETIMEAEPLLSLPMGPVRTLGDNRVGWIPNCEDAAPPRCAPVCKATCCAFCAFCAVRYSNSARASGGTCMVSITCHTRNTWEYTGKKGGFGRKGYVACTGGYKCIMHNACIGGLRNTSSLPIVMINVVFENTPFWALGVYGRILKAPIPQYTAVYSGVYGRILRVYGRILGVFVCTTWLFQVEKFHCCAFCAHLVAFFAFAQQLHTT